MHSQAFSRQQLAVSEKGIYEAHRPSSAERSIQSFVRLLFAES